MWSCMHDWTTYARQTRGFDCMQIFNETGVAPLILDLYCVCVRVKVYMSC